MHEPVERRGDCGACGVTRKASAGDTLKRFSRFGVLSSQRQAGRGGSLGLCEKDRVHLHPPLLHQRTEPYVHTVGQHDVAGYARCGEVVVRRNPGNGWRQRFFDLLRRAKAGQAERYDGQEAGELAARTGFPHVASVNVSRNLEAPVLHLSIIRRRQVARGENLEIPEIAQRLNVTHVLGGSVRKESIGKAPGRLAAIDFEFTLPQ